MDEDKTIDDTVNPEQEDEEEEGGKRAITYQVSDTLQYMIKIKYYILNKRHLNLRQFLLTLKFCLYKYVLHVPYRKKKIEYFCLIRIMRMLITLQVSLCSQT